MLQGKTFTKISVGLAIIVALPGCINGTMGTANGVKTTSTQNAGTIQAPVLIVGTGTLSVDATFIGAFTGYANSTTAKGMLLSIGKQMEVLSRSYGGLTAMLNLAVTDATFGSQIITIMSQDAGIKIQLPLARLNLGNGTLYNGIIVRPDGRVSLVHSHVMPDGPASIRQTHSDRISVFGGSIAGDPSDRIIRLPINGGIGIPGLTPDSEGAVLFSSHSDEVIAISAHAVNLPVAYQSNMNLAVNDMIRLNRTSYSIDGTNAACTDPQYANADLDRILSQQGSSMVISRKVENGVLVPDEVYICGDSSQGKLQCMVYCWSWVVNPVVNYCGTQRLIRGCDTVKRNYLNSIVGAIARPTAPVALPLLTDADGTGQIATSPL